MALLDAENFVDYVLLNVFIGNKDWPSHNWWASRFDDPTQSSDWRKFRFYSWDAEWSLIQNANGIDYDFWNRFISDAEHNTNGLASLFHNLAAWADFRELVMDRFEYWFAGDSTAQPPLAAEIGATGLDALWTGERLKIGSHLLTESARWGDAWPQPGGFQNEPYPLGPANWAAADLPAGFWQNRISAVWNELSLYLFGNPPSILPIFVLPTGTPGTPPVAPPGGEISPPGPGGVDPVVGPGVLPVGPVGTVGPQTGTTDGESSPDEDQSATVTFASNGGQEMTLLIFENDSLFTNLKVSSGESKTLDLQLRRDHYYEFHVMAKFYDPDDDMECAQYGLTITPEGGAYKFWIENPSLTTPVDGEVCENPENDIYGEIDILYLTAIRVMSPVLDPTTGAGKVDENGGAVFESVRKLKISKLELAFDIFDNLKYLEQDPDHFYVKFAGGEIGDGTFKISTVENKPSNSDYNDEATLIELEEDRSVSLVLV
jgi:hypothetical protein